MVLPRLLFKLIFHVAGNVQNKYEIISGEIDRGNKTWSFEADNVTRFRATLLNGNMVNGIGYQPDYGPFIFTAVAAS